ncbi:glycosyltransferase [Aequorivita sp. H23M31]|uniref:Glycosyltransferase n=1 Tax=Aequorivita ciconiae TaxID=2494375 RepID=A0A410G269_9FLAO|nr:glycosyltransferase family 4 protein [Aequorivita sp. H23M31]QAA81364.1 glycosyltransferase [Aequorivita sp. H23M31]
MQKTKILFTIPNFDTAGSGKVVHDLVKGLDKNKFEVEIACRHDRGEFFKVVQSLNVPIHLIETTCAYRPYASLLFRLRPIIKFFKENNYDIVHSWHYSSDWTEVLAARLAGAKWIYTKKAMSWGNRHWKIRSFLANFIIIINNEMQQYFPNKKNQALIPLGIDTNYYSPNHFPKPINREEHFQIITVANLVPVKGIEVLIQAIKESEDPKIRLIVLGDDANEYGAYLKNLCDELNMTHQVAFLGKRPDVRPYIADSDLYVIPTIGIGEGLGMALVEAMSMEIPVLGSDISGVNFVLKDFKSLLFEAGNALALSQDIKRMQSRSFEERQQLGADLRTHVLNNYNYDSFIEAHENLYKELVNRKT